VHYLQVLVLKAGHNGNAHLSSNFADSGWTQAEQVAEAYITISCNKLYRKLEMWANAQRDGRPAEYRWRPLFNAAKFGWRPLLDAVQ